MSSTLAKIMRALGLIEAPALSVHDVSVGKMTADGKEAADYPDFITLVRQVVLPLHQEHPTWDRMDGIYDMPGRAIAWFRWGGDRCILFSDTRFAPILAAHDWMLAHPGEDPLVRQPIYMGDSRLMLRPEIGWEDRQAVHISRR